MIKLKLGASGIGVLAVVVLSIRYFRPTATVTWLILLGSALVFGWLIRRAVVDPLNEAQDPAPGRHSEAVQADHVTLTETRERITRSISGPVDKIRQLMPGTAWGSQPPAIAITNGESHNGE